MNYLKYVQKPKPKPKALYHDWYTQDIKKLPDGEDRNKEAKIAVESLTRIMDEHNVSEGEKIFVEINKKMFEENYQKTSYFKHFDECPRYIYFNCFIYFNFIIFKYLLFIIIIILNKLLILKCNNFDIFYDFRIKFESTKNN